METLIKRQVFLDCEFADAIRRDWVGGRGFRRGNLLCRAVEDAARGNENDTFDRQLSAEFQGSKVAVTV